MKYLLSKATKVTGKNKTTIQKATNNGVVSAPKSESQTTNKKFKKTFIFGLGSAKSGTSWLYSYLASHPQFKPGPAKEMHVISNHGERPLIRNIIDLPYHRFRGIGWLNYNLQKAYYKSNWQRYYRLYEKILESDFQATADISPSYMSLKPEKITLVRTEFEKREINFVGALILRDPVERVISNLRYDKFRASSNKFRPDILKTLDKQVYEFIEAGSAESDQEYGNGIKLISECFSEGTRFTALYEDLFEQRQMDRLCEVCGLQYHKGEFSKRSNQSPRYDQVNIALLFKLRRHLQPAYDAAESYFGAEHLERYWKNYHL